MSFVDINDPRGLCKDVTGLGHQGNGDVEAAFTSLEELPVHHGVGPPVLRAAMGIESE